MKLTYAVVRSDRRKKLTITVERDRSIIVHAPTETPEATIREAIEAKRQWLLAKLRHPQKYQRQQHPPGKEVVSGESASYLGRDYRIELAQTASGNVEFAGMFLVPPAHQAKRREVLKMWYTARAAETILPRVEQHARELGVSSRAAKIVDHQYRWGSCTPQKTITFNWRLIKAPTFVIDYIIIHELAHLLEPNHSPAFWNIVRAKTPRMDKAKTWLKEHGQVLEQEV